jgi:site-specific DNA-methyltransferase (adenine-specific)
VVTEVSALYRRKPVVALPDGGEATLQEWFRGEWRRAGLTQQQANEACGVRSAASRKYLTGDAQWYFPPADMLARMIAYANERGREDGRPYFSLDGKTLIDTATWESLRATWNHENGITNVWARNPLAGEERIRRDGNGKALHLNQKPLDLMERQIRLASNEGDVVWEPFGGLASASVAAVRLGRRAFVAEPNEAFARIAEERLRNEVGTGTRDDA